MLVKQEHYSDYIIRTFNLKRVSCCCRCCCLCQRPLDSEIYKYEIFTIISCTKQCSRVSQRHFGGKRDSRRHDVLVASHGQKLSNIRRFIILRSGDGLTSFNKDKRYNFSGKRKVQSSLPWCLFFESTRKNLKSSPYSWSFSSSNLKPSMITALFSFAIPAFISHVLVIWWWLSISVNAASAVSCSFFYCFYQLSTMLRLFRIWCCCRFKRTLKKNAA